MNSAVQIHIDTPHGLHFRVIDNDRQLLATTTPFRSICQLESALTLLSEIATNPGSVAIEYGDDQTLIGPAWRRARVKLIGVIHDSAIRAMLLAVATADVVDDRPSGRRRTHVAGRLCDFSPSV